MASNLHRLLQASAIAATIATSWAQTTTRISTSSKGIPGNHDSQSAGLSADGSRAVFASSATNLDASIPYVGTQVFAYERATGAVTVVSLASNGNAANGNCSSPFLSPNGRFVIFGSLATNLAPPDSNAKSDVYIRDLQLHVTARASLTSAGLDPNAKSNPLGISNDGRFAAFYTTATNVVANDVNGASDVFVRDLVANTTELVSQNSAGVHGNAYSADGGISGDGQLVVFTSDSTNLVANDTNASSDVFLRNRAAGTTSRISVSALGVEGDQYSILPRISTDGRWVVYVSGSTNLVPGDTNGADDAFVYDVQTGAVERIDVSSSGAEANGPMWDAVITGDGRYVAFASYASNLVLSPDTNNSFDVFVRDRQLGLTWRASQDSLGSASDGKSVNPQASDDGSTVVYESFATNLVAGDNAAVQDVFLTSSQSLGVVTSYGTAKTNSNGCVSAITTVGFPRASGDDAFFVATTNVLNQKSGIFFWGRQAASIPFGGGTLLVHAPIIRTSVQNSGGSPSGVADCSGTFSYHFAQSYMASSNVLAGDTIYGQFWSRDPGFAIPNNIGLSNAVSFVVSP